MSEPTPDLTFDRAAYAAPGASDAALCGSCKKALAQQYWKWQRLIVCDGCKTGLEATLAKSQSASSFGRALLKGGGAALGCGIAYAVFVGVTHIQFALATIGIAIVVATVVRKASHGVSGRRFQVLAVALTYMASTLGYAPGIFGALKDSGKHHVAASAASSSADSAGLHPASVPAASPPDAHESESAVAGGNDDAGPAGAPKKAVGPLSFLVAIALLAGVTLAAPFLELPEAPLGVLIIGIGLWEAWRRSRGVPLAIEGPFRVASQEALPPAA